MCFSIVDEHGLGAPSVAGASVLDTSRPTLQVKQF